jgi:anti-sigma B factor antagonist
VNLQIATRETGGVTIVDLTGRATIGDDNDALNKTLQKLVDGGTRHLLLNLADLIKVDSSSIGTIAAMFVRLKGHGGSLKLLCPHGDVRQALNVTRLLERIPTFEDEKQALATFDPRGHSAAN